jgi:hypothetical protein
MSLIGNICERAVSTYPGTGTPRTTMFRFVGIIAAATWGLAGGLAAGLVSLSASVVAAGFKWPWHDNEHGMWPRLFVAGVGLILGALVAAAAHGQMSGGWPAFIMGVSAPSIIRGTLSKFEVTPQKAEPIAVAKADEHAA